jgi:hypothetical protein
MLRSAAALQRRFPPLSMSTSLFALTGDALLLQRQIDDTAERLFSEDPADVAAATEALEQLITAEASNKQALASKADAWCWVIDSLRSQATARREHATRLRDLADQAERRAEALQDQLVGALGRVDPDATRWELPEHRITSRKTTAVELDPDLAPEDLPEQFRRTRTTTSADRTALAAALKAGEAIDGAQLVERRSWRIA